MIKTTRNLTYKFFSVIVLILGVVSPFYLMRYGINFSDEPYQIMSAMDYLQNPSTILSAYIYNLIGQCCDFSLLSMRAITVIISIITLLIPLLYFYNKRRNIWDTLCVGGIALFLMSAIQQKTILVGWDILSNLFIALSTIILLYIVEAKRLVAGYLLLGFFVALAIMSRIPNVVLIPIVLCVICINSEAINNKLKDVISFVISMCVTMLFVIIYLYGDINSYIIAWQEWGVSNGHDFLDLLKIYLKDIVPYICLMGIIIMIYLSLYYLKQIRGNLKYTKVKYLVMAFWSSLLLLILYQYESLNIVTSNIYTSIYILIALYILYKNQIGENSKTIKKILFVVFLCSLVSAIGSNTGWFKVAHIPSIICLLTLFLPYVTKTIKDTLTILLVALFLFLPYSKIRESFFDKGLSKTTAQLSVPYLNGIYTTNENKDLLNYVYEKERNSTAEDVLFVGFGRQMFEYILDCRAHYARQDFYGILEDEKYISSTKEYLSRVSTIKRVYVVNRNYLYYNTPMDDMLNVIGFKLKKRENCYREYEKN